jgi:hypothetical protein
VRALHDHHHQVHAFQRTRRGAVQIPVQRPALAGMDARRVHEHRLHAALGTDAEQAVACGLRLGRGDGELLPDQAVQQRRLADVRPADNGDGAGALDRCGGLSFGH